MISLNAAFRLFRLKEVYHSECTSQHIFKDCRCIYFTVTSISMVEHAEHCGSLIHAHCVNESIFQTFILHFQFSIFCGGTAAAAPPRSGLATLPSVGAIPLSSHVHTRGFSVFLHACMFIVFIVFIFVFLQCFDTVGWVIRPVKILSPK